MNPLIKGVYTVSWFLSEETGRFFPHLAWLRSKYADEGVYMVDMEAAPRDSGLLVHSSEREKLYDEGKFNPRRSLVIWPRDEMLDWAARHPELANDDDEPIAQVPDRFIRSSISPRPIPRGKHNSPFHLWDGLRLLNRNPKLYFILLLFAPALAAAFVAGLALTWWIGIPAFVLVFTIAWIFQYYCFQ
jgi:hypothetical protein